MQQKKVLFFVLFFCIYDGDISFCATGRIAAMTQKIKKLASSVKQNTKKLAPKKPHELVEEALKKTTLSAKEKVAIIAKENKALFKESNELSDYIKKADKQITSSAAPRKEIEAKIATHIQQKDVEFLNREKNLNILESKPIKSPVIQKVQRSIKKEIYKEKLKSATKKAALGTTGAAIIGGSAAGVYALATKEDEPEQETLDKEPQSPNDNSTSDDAKLPSKSDPSIQKNISIKTKPASSEKATQKANDSFLASYKPSTGWQQEFTGEGE